MQYPFVQYTSSSVISISMPPNASTTSASALKFTLIYFSISKSRFRFKSAIASVGPPLLYAELAFPYFSDVTFINVSRYTETSFISFVLLLMLATIMQSLCTPPSSSPSLESKPNNAIFV